MNVGPTAFFILALAINSMPAMAPVCNQPHFVPALLHFILAGPGRPPPKRSSESESPPIRRRAQNRQSMPVTAAPTTRPGGPAMQKTGSPFDTPKGNRVRQGGGRLMACDRRYHDRKSESRRTLASQRSGCHQPNRRSAVTTAKTLQPLMPARRRSRSADINDPKPPRSVARPR